MALKSSNPLGTNSFYNLITVILLILTAMVACGVVYMIATAPPTAAGYGVEPTLFVFPTETPTLRGPTPAATSTASVTPEASVTPTATRTLPPTITSTPTNTPTATDTMTPTLIPTITPTFTPSNTPTATQRAQYDFALDHNDTVVFTANNSSTTGNTQGCSWTAISGTVLNRSRGHLTGYIVRLTGGRANVDFRATSGSKPSYGFSGWEFYLNADPQNLNGETFNLWLEYSDGKQASKIYSVTTRKSCTENLVLATFIQMQDRQ